MVFYETILAAESVWASAGIGFTRAMVVGSLAILLHTHLTRLPLLLPQLSLEFISGLPIL